MPNASSFAWVRAPATGTAFLLVLARTALPSLPASVRMPTCARGAVTTPASPAHAIGEPCAAPELALARDYPIEQGVPWPAAIAQYARVDARVLGGAHRVVALFRDPRARAIASYRRYADEFSPAPPFPAYAARIVGSVTRMVAGQARGDACHSPRAPCARPTPDLPTALARLERFAFVGMAERWRRSVCLFHAIFGGRCHLTELLVDRSEQFISRHVRFANFSLPKAYDQYDTVLYYHAKARFLRDAMRYRVDGCACHLV